MEGSLANPGINVRALSELFSIASEEGGGGQGSRICVSMMEIYQEAVHDLLRQDADALKPYYHSLNGSRFFVHFLNSLGIQYLFND